MVTQHLAGADGRCRRGHGTFHPCRECHRIPQILPAGRDNSLPCTDRRIRIVGGPLNEYEGSLLTTRGSKVKRLARRTERISCCGVEVDPEYIQLILTELPMAFISNLSAPSLFWTVNSILVFIVCALSAGVLYSPDPFDFLLREPV
ncbi:MAG: hypothetical protein ACLUVG_00380 [Phocaeicola vulgatus]